MMPKVRGRALDGISRLLFLIAAVLVVVIVTAQIAMRQGRAMGRAEGSEYLVREISSLLRSDGYEGQLVYRDGDVRIVYSYASARARKLRAMNRPSPYPLPMMVEGKKEDVK